MPESSPQAPTEFTTLPIVIDGELTDNFDSPDLLEGPPSEATPIPEATTSPASLAVGEVVDIGLTPQHPDKLSLRDRFYRSRLGRLAMGGLAALGLAAGGVAVEASPAIAASNPVYTVTNHDNDGTNGIYYRNSPRMADSIRQLPYYARYGDRIELICGTNGEAVGQYGNRRWHLVRDLDNPKAPNQFYIPDHDTNTPNRANRPTPGERECGEEQRGNTQSQKSGTSHNLLVTPIYDRERAVAWARKKAREEPTYKASCMQFVSQALWAGGLPKEPGIWTDEGEFGRIQKRPGTRTAWSVEHFESYILNKYPQSDKILLSSNRFRDNRVPEAQIGDIILYDWRGDGEYDHATIITEMVGNNYPEVSEWSIYGGTEPTPYVDRGWTYSEKDGLWLQHPKKYPNVVALLIHIDTEQRGEF